MSNALANAAPMGLADLQRQSQYTDDDFKGVGGTGGRFLPRLQLFTSNSKEVKKRLIECAHYGMLKGKNDLAKLGENVVVVPLAWRAKALDMRGETVMAFHNPKSKEFQDIKAIADGPGQDLNVMYGPEFLVFVPNHGLATFLMGSITARNEATVLRPFITDPPSAVVLSAEYIETDKYSWHGPKVTASDQTPDLPPAAVLVEEVKKFLSPKDSEVQEQAAAGTTNEDR